MSLIFPCSPLALSDDLFFLSLSFTCQLAAVPSGRARARRNLSARSLCSASGEEACAVEGGKGFECVDTTVRFLYFLEAFSWY